MIQQCKKNGTTESVQNTSGTGGASTPGSWRPKADSPTAAAREPRREPHRRRQPLLALSARTRAKKIYKKGGRGPGMKAERSSRDTTEKEPIKPIKPRKLIQEWSIKSCRINGRAGGYELQVTKSGHPGEETAADRGERRPDGRARSMKNPTKPVLRYRLCAANALSDGANAGNRPQRGRPREPRRNRLRVAQ